jgi:sulfonate dioxygenase
MTPQLLSYTPIQACVLWNKSERAGTLSGFWEELKVTSLTPALGDEIDGVDLTKFDSDSKDQLALQVARRGVLVFRNQEQFLSKDKDWFRNWGAYFGR